MNLLKNGKLFHGKVPMSVNQERCYKIFSNLLRSQDIPQTTHNMHPTAKIITVYILAKT